ncbi:4724_t:CDS:2 [Entrophospora sp. SA101]|nr:4724_t:CDS:2 [Entrophospora sp. SA101]
MGTNNQNLYKSTEQAERPNGSNLVETITNRSEENFESGNCSTSFGNIPITIPVQYEINKEDDTINRNVINEVLVEEEMEEYEEEISTTKHLSDPNERKRTIYSTNNNQEENGNVVREKKELIQTIAESIQKHLNVNEFFSQN